MSLRLLNDHARALGLGALYEAQMAAGAFRGLFDHGSAEWRGTAVAEKVAAIRAFEAAGISAAELIGHYCQTHEGLPDGAGTIGRLPETLDQYRQAGHPLT